MFNIFIINLTYPKALRYKTLLTPNSLHPMNCQISRANFNDLHLMQRLFYQTVTSHGSKVFSKEEIKIYSRLALDKQFWREKFESEYIYNAKLNGEVIGSFAMDRMGNISYIFVHMHYHGRGIAGQLFDTILQVAKSREINYLTAQANESMLFFYRKKGFEIMENVIKAVGGEEMVNYEAVKKI